MFFLQKWWKKVLSQFVLRKYFWQNYLFHSSKEVFFHNFRQFLENWILKEYRQARTLQKWWKFVLSQFVLRKYFLAKLFVPLIKGSVSPQFYAIFGKLNFGRNIYRRGTLQKWWKFVLSQFVIRKYFLAKLFVPLIKRSVPLQF